MWGLKAYIKADYGESIIKFNENLWKFDLGALGSLNFNERFNVPVGITLGYSIQKFTLIENNPEDQTQTLSFELTYTHLYNFNIGLIFSYLNAETPLLKTSSNLKFFTASFLLSYYF